jgi:hypothetical protein
MKGNQQTSLLSVFENLDEDTKEVLADLESPLLLGLAALLVSESQAQRQYLSAEHIVAALEAAGVAVTRNQIVRAFSKAGNKINRKILEGDLYYRIMTKGKRQIEPYIQTGEISVSYIHEGKPRTARKILSQLFNNLKGVIRVCDPYYGIRSLEALEMIPEFCKVRFLSSQSSENAIKLSNAIDDFKKEHSNIEIRVFAASKSIHDRYVLSEESLLILGHGIKDIGNKESFVINISREHAEDLLVDLIHSFDDRWNKSTPI